jgi:hypothetical protein
LKFFWRCVRSILLRLGPIGQTAMSMSGRFSLYENPYGFFQDWCVQDTVADRMLALMNSSGVASAIGLRSTISFADMFRLCSAKTPSAYHASLFLFVCFTIAVSMEHWGLEA